MPPASIPSFFISYARVDGANLVRRFFEDLQATIRSRAPIPADYEIGLFDLRTGMGLNWDGELSEGLKRKKALVAVASAPYFGNANCGKEVAVFVRRHKQARLDQGGCLKDVTNILPIRWYDAGAYASNGNALAHIHPTMRKLNWMPPQNGTPGRIAAIKKYTDGGMQLCVKPGKNFYVELLRLFADTIRDMPDLPEADFPVSWDDVKNAFEPGWDDVQQDSPGTAAAAASTTFDEPKGLGCAALFYLTQSKIELDSRAVSFADRLVQQDSWTTPSGVNPVIPTVIKAAQIAASNESLRDFHCAYEPTIAPDTARLIGQLAALAAQNVRTALIVDEDLLSTHAQTWEPVLRQILESDLWQGPVAIVSATPGAQTTTMSSLVENLQRAVVTLPTDKDALVAAWRSIFVQERSRIVSQAASRAAKDNEPPPLLSGPTRQ